MKRFFTKYILGSTAAVAILLCTLGMSSCSVVSDMATEMYWNLDNPAPVDPDQVLDTLCVIRYSVNNQESQRAIHTSADLDMLLYMVLFETQRAANDKGTPTTLVRSNHSGSQAPLKALREEPVVKFPSADQGKVKEWVKKMLLKGYRVEVVYDKRAKVYNCTAVQRR
ncbi:MAG: hypothetical protein IJ785_03520 [Bacteroidales bacterium]|nr:hypothetical protein [Bacteroidales bacterium]